MTILKDQIQKEIEDTQKVIDNETFKLNEKSLYNQGIVTGLEIALDYIRGTKGAGNLYNGLLSVGNYPCEGRVIKYGLEDDCTNFVEHVSGDCSCPPEYHEQEKGS